MEGFPECQPRPLCSSIRRCQQLRIGTQWQGVAPFAVLGYTGCSVGPDKMARASGCVPSWTAAQGLPYHGYSAALWV